MDCRLKKVLNIIKLQPRYTSRHYINSSQFFQRIDNNFKYAVIFVCSNIRIASLNHDAILSTHNLESCWHLFCTNAVSLKVKLLHGLTFHRQWYLKKSLLSNTKKFLRRFVLVTKWEAQQSISCWYFIK